MYYMFGFSRWKRRFIKPFLPNEKMLYVDTLEDAIRQGLCEEDSVCIWGRKSFPNVEHYVEEQNIALFRVEDGFVRSVSLGSDLTKAYSLVIDGRGIYFDPTQESDLEVLLNTYDFDTILLERSKKLQRYLVEKKISKYNVFQEKELVLKDVKQGQKVIMVPGQVEDDASIVYGANGMTNLELLQQCRVNEPKSYIIYKPHPDVLAGNRKGHIVNSEALIFCDSVIEEASIDSVLNIVDEVHTMTSLVGFEALMRGKKVHTYGLPFYAGWGLTVDSKSCLRRKVKRTLDELVAAALILYPYYIHPKTNIACEIETLLNEIDKEKKRYNHDKIYRLYINTRNMFSRKVQLLIKILLEK